MVDACDEGDFGGFEGIVGGEVDVEEEHASGIGGVFGTDNRGLPVELVLLVLGTGGTVGRWVSAQVNQFLHQRLTF